MHFAARTVLPVFALFIIASTPLAAQSLVTKAFLTGHTNYGKDTSFIKVGAKYADKTVYLKKEAYKAYQLMYADALKAGIKLNILSGTRSFSEQHSIWERKWNATITSSNLNARNIATAIMRWSSMPGTSRHHWGTDMDLVSLSPAYFKTAAGKKVYAWLCENAAKYGFYQPFNDGRSEGYQEEKWHWSYLPLSKIYLAEYIKQIGYNDITGFSGAEAAAQLDVIKSQVLAINLACK